MKAATWQLQEAKNRFSEVVNRAVTEGAQTITRHGKPTVVVLSMEEFRKASLPSPPTKKKWSMLAALRACPDKSLHERVSRMSGQMRDVAL